MTEFLIDSKSKGFTNNEGCNLLCSNNIDNNGNHGDSDTSSANEEVRTIFVSGLPMDAKQRELYLLFRSFKGFQTATLKPPGKNGKPTAPVGFVTFETRNQAENAIEQLEGIKFDPDSDQLMRLEFARTNTKMLKNKMYNSHVYNSGFNQQLPVSVDANLLNSEMNLVLGYDGRLAFFAQSAFSPFGPALLPFNGSTFRPPSCTFAPIAVSTPNGILYGNNMKLPNTPLTQGPSQSNQTISPFIGPQTGLLGETISQVLMHPNQNGFLYVQPFTIDLNEMNAQPLESQIRMNSWNSNAE